MLAIAGRESLPEVYFYLLSTRAGLPAAARRGTGLLAPPTAGPHWAPGQAAGRAPVEFCLASLKAVAPSQPLTIEHGQPREASKQASAHPAAPSSQLSADFSRPQAQVSGGSPAQPSPLYGLHSLLSHASSFLLARSAAAEGVQASFAREARTLLTGWPHPPAGITARLRHPTSPHPGQ